MAEIRIGLDASGDGEIDWEGYENVTPLVNSVSWNIGATSRQYMAPDGGISMSLHNEDGLFNPENTDSVFAGNIVTGTRIEVWVKDDRNVWQVRFVGAVSNLTVPTGLENIKITIDGEQNLKKLNKANLSGIEPQIDKRVDELIYLLTSFYLRPGQPALIIGVGAIGDAIGSNAYNYTVDNFFTLGIHKIGEALGITHGGRENLQESENVVSVFTVGSRKERKKTLEQEKTYNVLNMLKDLSQVDAGFLYLNEYAHWGYRPFVGLDGEATKTLDLDVAAMETTYELKFLSSSYANAFDVTWTEWSTVVADTLFVEEKTKDIDQGGDDLVMDLRIPTEVMVGEITDVTATYTTGTPDIDFTYDPLENKLKLTVSNVHVSEDLDITEFQIIGSGFVKHDEQVKSRRDTDSIKAHGKMLQAIDNPYVQNETTADDLAFFLARGIAAQHITKFTISSDRNSEWHNFSMMNIADLINLSCDTVGHQSKKYFIQGAAGSWQAGGPVKMTFHVHPALSELFFSIGSAIGSNQPIR